MTNLHKLEPLTFPLQGQQLIEASAGTGKTYTITALYLRLLLGQGDLTETPLGPDQILVVTFTEAATEELRDRIRQKIMDARTAFLEDSEPEDELLRLIKKRCNDPMQAARLLEQAARQMDEAAIFTIHGFCQRMLKRHAFESGSLFDNELTQDDFSLIRNAVLDFWRCHIYPLSAPLTELAYQCWKSPEQLLADIRGILNRSGLQLQPDLSQLDLQAAFDERQSLLLSFKQNWLQNEEDLSSLIQASGVNKRSYTKTSVPKWLAQIDQYAASEQREPGKKLLDILQRFSQDVLSQKSAENSTPEHPLFQEIERLLQSAVPVKEILLGRAFTEVSSRLDKVKQQLQLLTFDDLLSNLYSALERDRSGTLARAIREQFPVAMIDEFQDTDPLQYGIFARLYTDPYNSALVMIGDPKQAIYSFRGADIFTYIQARRSMSDTYTLDTNWRSTSDMVDAVNQLFLSSQSPFIYDQDITFQAVKAAKGEQGLLIQSQPAPAMTYWLNEQDESLSRAQYLSRYAKSTACEIDRLLSGEATIKGSRVQGGDIAILVRDRNEADEIKRALLEYEHPSVYLSNRDSVFNSDAAIDLSLLLQAIEDPQNERVVKAALATELLHLDMLQLDQLNSDESLWESVLAEFMEYHELWLKQGVLPMLNRVLQYRNLAPEILARADGERILTNFLHLGELLQNSSVKIEGMTGLNRWFSEQIANPSGDSDDQVLRLESERNLVTIVTVHKSKGLEYPIVFLPFASLFKESKSAVYHADTGETILDISAADDSHEKAEQERLAEDLRLLYVALTRSVYSCYVGVSHVRQGNSKKSRLKDSALGYLLSESGETIEQSLEALQQRSQSVVIVPPPDHGAQKDLFAIAEQTQEPLAARAFLGKVDRNWRVSSYSALSRRSAVHLPELPGLDLEVAEERDDKDDASVKDGINIFTFPKGANAGTFLHSVFEEISFSRYSEKQYHAQFNEQLQLAGYDEQWLPVIKSLVRNVLHSDLDGEGLCLSDIQDCDRLVEMEFMLSADHVTVSALESLIRQHDPLSARASPLAFEPLQGMLKGFIDLLFRKEGRYYVLDYKSNHLGYDIGCYDTSSLEQAMVEHRYELQYLLYSLAVHRLLRQRIQDYDYDRHFGGVFYLFLRGMEEGMQSGVFNCRPPKLLVEQLDLLFSIEGKPLL
ncbi:MAG: exodeoxyribonuclease V subunit beta [Neptuniibacter sp.]